ncbi:MAG: hypothetical protein CENE_03226 [Candidatus Celerinatantimonas neptuna]|nr:MAG: hypothetical protein CENE_03226 [Candidatus Celerinatantimonas neptuna]
MNTQSQSEEKERQPNVPLLVCNDAPYATISELAEIYDIEANVVQQRLKAHWSLEAALTTHN